MTKMAVAVCAVHLRAGHAMGGIGRGAKGTGNGIIERGPAAATLVFRAGIEQRRATARATIFTGTLFIIQRAGTGALGPMFAQYAQLFRGQAATLRAPLSVLPDMAVSFL